MHNQRLLNETPIKSISSHWFTTTCKNQAIACSKFDLLECIFCSYKARSIFSSSQINICDSYLFLCV